MSQTIDPKKERLKEAVEHTKQKLIEVIDELFADEALRPTQQQPEEQKDPEQLQLDVGVAPALRGRTDEARFGFVENLKGVRFDWHAPVTTLNDEWYLWVTTAYPDRHHCKRQWCEEPIVHYHCHKCGFAIVRGKLHGSGAIHVCVDCLKPRTWGRRTYPDYGY